MNAVGVWGVVAAGGLAVAVAGGACLVAGVLAIAWAAPRGFRDVAPLLRHGVRVALEARRPSSDRSTAPMLRIGGGS